MIDPRQPSALDDFLFDLNGYLILKNVASPELLAKLNQEVDDLPVVEYGEWIRGAQRRDYTAAVGFELHQAVALGGAFADLIDNPNWINFVHRYAGEKGSYVDGLFIDESILSVRGPGGHHPAHSGGYQGALRGSYHYANGVFRCGQVNIILALTDIHEGDGATMVVPGSHKSNFPHPVIGDYANGDRMDDLPGAVHAYMSKGDALMFVDGLIHGGSSRTNEGERRVTIYRYGPIWGASRFGYQYSEDFLATLTERQRGILRPVPHVLPGDEIPKARWSG
ncbi:MAG: phytanoyl-CoA dioxygenase family protein [Armatimonadota bacterium]